MSCAVCGTALVPGARFCFHCGAPQVASAMEDAERRHVTVLFGDLSDFTAWAEDLDPERVGVVTDRVLAALARIVTDVGGHVDKLTGDGIMAVFGAPVAHEDDAERAVRAAAAMQREVLSLVSDEVGGGRRLGLRVGLNTGEVLAGVQGQLSYTVVGDTVNTASRLSDAAGVGSVYAGRETAAATMHTAAWRGLPPLRLKGKREPVEAFELIRLRSGVTTRLGIGDEAPLVGRAAELGALLGRLEKVTENAAPSSVLVFGDAGSGKSRLVGELTRVAGETPGTRVLVGRCSPYGMGRDLQPFAEMVRTACGIDISDTAAVALQRLEQTFTRLERLDPGRWSATAAAKGLLPLLGEVHDDVDRPPEPAPPGARVEQRELEALGYLLVGLASEGPLVLVFEDIHHAPPATIAALRELGQRLAGPVLTVVVARSEELAPDAYDVLLHLRDPELLPVEPLDTGASEQLLRAFLGGAELPAALRTDLVARAQGNPFFLAELLQLLIDRGVLRAGADGSWQAVGNLPRELLPAGVQAVLAARIDSLEPAARTLVREAAVIGYSFHAAALPALDPRLAGEHVSELLASLADRGILTDEGRGRWRFTHILARDVAYAALPKVERARRHAAVALWALREAQAPEAELDAIVAAHADQAVALAQEMGLPPRDESWSVAEAGFVAAARLGRRALRRDDNLGARHHLARALRLAAVLDPPPADLPRTEVAYASALAGLYRLEEAESHLADALDAVDPTVRAGALLVLGDVEEKRAAPGAARAAFSAAYALASTHDLDLLTGSAIRQLGLLDFFGGRLAAAEERFRQALDLAERIGDHRGAGWALQNLAWSATTRGDYPVAEDALHRASEVFQSLEDTGGLAWCTQTEALVNLLQGHLAAARELVASLAALPREGRGSWEVATCAAIDALAAIDLGALEEADVELTAALHTFEALRDSWGLVFGGIGRGQLARARGELEVAATTLRRACDLAERHGHTPLILLASVSLGLLHLDRGDIEAAAACAARAEDLIRDVDIRTGALIGLWVLRSRVDRAQGRPDVAAALLGEALEGNIPNYLFPRRQAYAHLAATQLEQDQVEDAYATIRRALAEPAEDVRSRVVAQRVLAQVLLRRGDDEGARAAAQEAIALVEAAGYDGELEATRRVLGRVAA